MQVFIVAPVTFMIMQQMSHTICSPKLIAIFSQLEKNLKGQADHKDVKFYHFIGQGKQFRSRI